MMNIVEKVYGNVMVVERADCKWGVVNSEGDEIVPFGIYDWIDGFDHGLARVKIGKQPSNMANSDNKWGIINEAGEEVLPCEYDEVWNFLGKNRTSTKVVKDGVSRNVSFDELLYRDDYDDYNDYDDYDYDDYDDYDGGYSTEHYEGFAGTYAQDVAGYSDEDIYDIFDGDPNAYWNID